MKRSKPRFAASINESVTRLFILGVLSERRITLTLIRPTLRYPAITLRA